MEVLKHQEASSKILQQHLLLLLPLPLLLLLLLLLMAMTRSHEVSGASEEDAAFLHGVVCLEVKLTAL